MRNLKLVVLLFAAAISRHAAADTFADVNNAEQVQAFNLGVGGAIGQLSPPIFSTLAPAPSDNGKPQLGKEFRITARRVVLGGRLAVALKIEPLFPVAFEQASVGGYDFGIVQSGVTYSDIVLNSGQIDGYPATVGFKDRNAVSWAPYNLNGVDTVILSQIGSGVNYAQPFDLIYKTPGGNGTSKIVLSMPALFNVSLEAEAGNGSVTLNSGVVGQNASCMASTSPSTSWYGTFILGAGQSGKSSPVAVGGPTTFNLSCGWGTPTTTVTKSLTLGASGFDVSLSAERIASTSGGVRILTGVMGGASNCTSSSVPAGVWNESFNLGAGDSVIRPLTIAGPTTFMVNCTFNAGSITVAKYIDVGFTPFDATLAATKSGNSVVVRSYVYGEGATCSASTNPASSWSGTFVLSAGSTGQSNPVVIGGPTAFVLQCRSNVTGTNLTRSIVVN